jgi:enterochelin esterase-like enzyme
MTLLDSEETWRKPRYQRTLRVHYPPEAGDVLLHLGGHEDRLVEPTRKGQGGACCEFDLVANVPFRYVRPVLRPESGDPIRARQRTMVTLTPPSPRELYPSFFASAQGTITPVLEVPSAILDRDHVVRIYLPPGYEENALKRYPVLYMHDGTNLFFPEEAFLGREWTVDETMDVLDSMSLIDKTIVVGVHAGKDVREDEYTRPGYEAYGRSLVEELKPYVDQHLRTLPGPHRTSVMGSSLGGVLSFFLAWEWPEVFGSAGCLSSTFGWRDDLLERVLTEPKRPARFYLDSGWPGDNYEVTVAMAVALKHRGWTYGLDLLHLGFPGAKHEEPAWAERLPIPFQWLVGRAVRPMR